MEGLAELRRALPPAWKGFANFIMRQPGRRGQDREIDVVLITADRIILADLKFYRGRIENQGGIWYRGGARLGASPAHKIRELAKILASTIQKELPQLRAVPPVESVVILTNPAVDPSGLDKSERDRTVKLADFLRIGDTREFQRLFTIRSKFDTSAPLHAGTAYAALHRFFRNGRLFEPRRALYHGYTPIGDAELKHRLFSEYTCHDVSNPSYTGLLRLWNFAVDDTFAVEEARRPIAERERSILGHLRIHDQAFYDNYVFRSVAHDVEFTLGYSEVFDRKPDLERFTRFAGSLADFTIARRIELARLFLDRVAALHRIRVAHRDLDRHSVWIDDRRSRVVLSAFGAAHFPEKQTVGTARSKLLAGGHRLGDLGQTLEFLSVPGESGGRHHDVLPFALPLAHQHGARA